MQTDALNYPISLLKEFIHLIETGALTYNPNPPSLETLSIVVKALKLVEEDQNLI
jgi:hypothetical protein